MTKVDVAEIKAAEAMIRFSAALFEGGQPRRSKEITKIALSTFRDVSFSQALRICAGEEPQPGCQACTGSKRLPEDCDICDVGR
jgi:hypothetical protein